MRLVDLDEDAEESVAAGDDGSLAGRGHSVDHERALGALVERDLFEGHAGGGDETQGQGIPAGGLGVRAAAGGSTGGAEEQSEDKRSFRQNFLHEETLNGSPL